MITQERLKELFYYDADTGIFTRLISTAPRSRAGSSAGSKNGAGYPHIQIDKKKYKSHRLAFLYTYGIFPSFIDHINGVRDDNRISNLREVTRKENSQNSKKYKRYDSSIPTGVSVIKNHKGVINAYRVEWKDITGKNQKSQNFNFKKLGGQEVALQQAKDYRDARILELMQQGAMYTNRHGK